MNKNHGCLEKKIIIENARCILRLDKQTTTGPLDPHKRYICRFRGKIEAKIDSFQILVRMIDQCNSEKKGPKEAFYSGLQALLTVMGSLIWSRDIICLHILLHRKIFYVAKYVTGGSV